MQKSKLFQINIYLFFFLQLNINGKLLLNDERKYQNLVIYIDGNVPENGGKLLEFIKVQMTSASKALFEATSNMGKKEYGIYFGEIYVIVPTNWNIAGDKITWQNCEMADVKIVTKTSNGNSDKPFTKQSRKCGQPGEYSRFPYEFFVDGSQPEKTIEKHGKIILQEFVKLRYGVFSEEPERNRILAFDGKKIKYSVCNENISIETNRNDIKCSEPNDVCHYKIKENQNHNYSIMFDVVTPSSKYFCNDAERPHHKYARNLHNRICKKQSVTTVILQHDDFKNVSPKVINYENPTFKIVKNEKRKIVLVLDISGSMMDVIEIMKTAVQEFIEDMVEDTAELGIVTFNDEARILSPLLKMDKKENKEKLTDLVKNIRCHDSTNIGHGLQLGIEVLGGNILTKDKLHGTIILLSDGENNEEEPIEYTTAVAGVIGKGVIVNVVSYNQSDQQLISLSKQTGGKFLHVDYNASITELLQKFAFRKPCDLSQQGSTKVKDGQINIGGGNNRYPFTYIDKFTGSDTVISVDFPKDISNQKITLLDPDGKKINPSKSTVNNNKTTLTFKIPGKSKPGQYWIEIARKTFRYKRYIDSFMIQYSVFGNQSNANEKQIIIPDGEISQVLIENLTYNESVTVTIDLSSIRITNTVFVNLEIKSPNGNLTLLKMSDDGIGDDSVANDKIYTRNLFPKHISQKGYYTFRGSVKIQGASISERISRSVNFESLLVKRVDPSAFIDKVPPAQIPDPTVVIKDFWRRVIEIKTIATGDDSMEGKIDKYQILFSSIKMEILNVTKQAEPYEEIIFEMDLEKMNIEDPFEIAVRGVDEANNAGHWSSMISVNIDSYNDY